MESKRSTYRKIIRLRGGERVETEDQVVIEVPVTIYLNGSELVTLLCTPEKIDRLALGFLLSEGLLSSIDDLASIRTREEEGLVEIDLKDETVSLEKFYGKRTITSGCGKGTIFFNVIDSLRSKPLTGRLQIDSFRLQAMMHELQQQAALFKSTGGVHSAALADKERIIFFCEDIGRHNAVDKIIGESLIEGTSMDGKIFILSGRISSEILLKAAKLKIELIASRAAPTSLSIELAEKLNITLVGFVRGERMNIYTHQWRIITPL
ncbi:MAG: formate dehydrogenase accessory sulfurtransferase FdhD [Bacillota bacterium]|nr:formate dehydrogenase accessory sulfurtransferase FdhD [Bacillota bacterium]